MRSRNGPLGVTTIRGKEESQSERGRFLISKLPLWQVLSERWWLLVSVRRFFLPSVSSYWASEWERVIIAHCNLFRVVYSILDWLLGKHLWSGARYAFLRSYDWKRIYNRQKKNYNKRRTRAYSIIEPSSLYGSHFCCLRWSDPICPTMGETRQTFLVHHEYERSWRAAHVVKVSFPQYNTHLLLRDGPDHR